MEATITEQKGLSEAEAAAVKATKELAKRSKEKLGEPSIQRRRLSRRRQKPSQAIPVPDYHGLQGKWLSYYKVAQAYTGKVPAQDRDDIRHDIMLELDRATNRDGKSLPLLRAYRIASLMVALYYRNLYRFAIRVCVFSGHATEPHCQGCQNKTGKRCCWLAVRPVASLDSEILDNEGYSVKLVDTVASDKIEDMPERWYDINEIRQGLPLRLVEIAYLKREHRPLSKKDQKYLERYLKKAQKSLF